MTANKIIFALGAWLALALFNVNVQAQSEGYEVGDVAQGFSLMGVSGEMTATDDYPDAKGFIVVFTCNTCPYAVLYEDRINALNQAYAPLGFPVLAINPNDTDRKPMDALEHMITRAEEKNFSFPYLVDETQDITRAYGATRTPHTFVLEKMPEGELMVRYIGAIDDHPQHPDQDGIAYVAAAVDALLAGEEVSTTFTRAIGCSIKWAQ